ncbi:hypothetical protein ACFOHP_23705 [Couchioplanes caeruleus subsp. azureus]|uniref:hypothetical protein n=1 Tax=Couchioplanes caeruleus TaxID=56438 RepID=UPI00361A38FA
MRRTVIVAVGLVTGQALLCAVIGFVTFDGRGDVPSARSRVAAPKLDAPIAVPPPAPPAPTGSSRMPRGNAGAHLSKSSLPATRPASPAAPPAGSSRPSSAPLPASPPEPPPAPPIPPPLPDSPPSEPPDDRRRTLPVLGDFCADEGATGETGDGRKVRCAWDRHGDLRWRPDDRRRP